MKLLQVFSTFCLFLLVLLSPAISSKPKDREKQIECCENANCSKTCFTEPYQACVRKVCEPEERRLAKLEICPAGCGQQEIEYRVNYRRVEIPYKLDDPSANAQRSFVTFCKTEKCNAHKSLLEVCKFAPKVELEKLECLCSEAGMNGTFLGKLLDDRENRIDFAKLCKGDGSEKTCKFSEIRKELEAKNLWNPNYEHNPACVLKQTGDYNKVSYGCDIMSQPDVTGCILSQKCPISRVFSYNHGARGMYTTRLLILCNDASMCNTEVQTGNFQKQANSCHSQQIVVDGAMRPGFYGFLWLFTFTAFLSGFYWLKL